MNSAIAPSPDRAPPAPAPGIAPAAESLFAGLHEVEPDFAERGIWVERRLLLTLPPTAGGSLSLGGMYFPKLIAAQNGSEVSHLRFLLDGQEVHDAPLHAHGRFFVQFDLPATMAGNRPAELLVLTDHCFVPAQIGDGDDQRELCWRLMSLTVGNAPIFDCERPINILLKAYDPSAPPSAADDPQPVDSLLRGHLDCPAPAAPSPSSSTLAVSGWAFDERSVAAAEVCVVVGRQSHGTRPVERPDVQEAFRSLPGVPRDTGFLTQITPPVGLHRVRIEVRAPGGRWVLWHQGLLFSGPPTRPAAVSRWEHMLARVLPGALASRALDHLRSVRGAAPESQLPASFRFHLDAPKTSETQVITAECVVSGWVFDADTGATVPVRVATGQRVMHAHAKQREDVQKAFASTVTLPMNTGFACVLSLPAGLHRVRIEVQRTDGHWVEVRRATLLRIPGLKRRDRSAPRLGFKDYQRLHHKHQAWERPEIERHIEVMLDKPLFVVVVDLRDSDRGAMETLQSIHAQVYAHYIIRVLSPTDWTRSEPWARSASRLTDATLSRAEGDFVVFLRGGQRLSSLALYEFASALNQFPDRDLVYGDETIGAPQGRGEIPFYKPAWSPDYLETFDYIGFTACFRIALAADCIDDLQAVSRYDLALRLTERSHKVLHLPRILGHDPLRFPGGRAAERDVAALTGRLQRTGRQGSVTEHPSHRGCYRIALELRQQPLVSIVIPTAGKTIELDSRRIDLIVNVIGQIVDRSTYRNFEFVIIDNGDLSAAQIEVLDRAGCKRTTYTEPIFNISKKLNQGVALARGELLLLMNDDIEILSPDWIERLVEQFEKPHVGVVGAKLLYPDGKTQHVGVVHNSGNPDHVRRLYPRDEAGYFFSTCGTRNFAAVTGACMMTPASVYRCVGGYSEELAVSYNDADYCLKVGQAGYTVVYAPQVELVHMESQSRVASADMKEVAWYQQRWANEVVRDPYYNERFLTVASPTFVPCINDRLI